MTVRMHRDGKFADVHPDEVANFAAAGFNVVEEEKKAEPAKEPKPPVKKAK